MALLRQNSWRLEQHQRNVEALRREKRALQASAALIATEAALHEGRTRRAQLCLMRLNRV